MRIVAVTVALVLATGAVRADSEVPPPKSEDTAFWLSAGSTVGAGALIAVGAGLRESGPRWRDAGDNAMAFGVLATGFTPSFGEWYAQRYFTVGMGLRLAGTVIAGIGAVQRVCIDPADLDCPAPAHGQSLIVAGAIVYGAGAIYDIATASRAARSYNREHAAARAVVVPAALRGRSGLVPGLAVSARF